MDGSMGVLNGGIGDLAGIPGNDSINGLGIHTVDDLLKALSANAGSAAGGSDVASLTGGAALRVQSLEPTLARTMPEQKTFKLTNLLNAPANSAKSILDEYSVKRQHGGFPGSAFNGELDTIREDNGRYERKAVSVKFLMTMRRISGVQLQQETIVDSMAEEKLDAITEIKTSIEWCGFYGDASCNPLEYDGVRKQLRDWNDRDLLRDMRGKPLSFVAKELIELSAAVAQQERYGTLTHALMSVACKADLDQKLDGAWRIGPRDEVKAGTPVKRVRTDSNEDGIQTLSDVFVTEGGMPWEARGGKYADYVTSGGLTAPTSVSCSASPNANSQYLTAHAGHYYIRVESRGKAGRSATAVSSQATVAAGDRLVITITNPSDPNVTSYVIYKSRREGSNLASDMREMVVIPRQAGATTVFNDDNQYIAGTSEVFLLDLSPSSGAIDYRRLGGMIYLPLFVTNTFARTWAQIDLRYLRIRKPMNHALIYNVLPEGATWLPF